tara:strand:+ start:145 stop:327 length:183 start_codon:yes stop_codon:yes gene_type:complete
MLDPELFDLLITIQRRDKSRRAHSFMAFIVNQTSTLPQLVKDGAAPTNAPPCMNTSAPTS